MFEFASGLEGYSRFVHRIVQGQIAIPYALNKSAKDAADRANMRFISVTPELSGAARAGWRVRKLGEGTYAVVNAVERRGFSYPGALITGTGARGVPAPGFHDVFNMNWYGMKPNSALRYAWIEESSRPLAIPKLFR